MIRGPDAESPLAYSVGTSDELGYLNLKPEETTTMKKGILKYTVAVGALLVTAGVAWAASQPKVNLCHKGHDLTLPLNAALNHHKVHAEDTFGRCGAEAVCACPFIYLPVTCSDGVTYDNQCDATCVGATDCHQTPFTCVDGSSPACQLIYLPVSCSDGNTYANECVGECLTGAACSPLCACDTTFNPVVCDGTEYANSCEAVCAGARNCTPCGAGAPEPCPVP
jgi:hypothetical protein